MPPEGALTWDWHIKVIVTAISNLNQSAKLSKKHLFLDQSRAIIGGIREMLVASSTLDKDSFILQTNKKLRNNHYSLMSSLSKLVLSVKTASGVWPPPDATDKMRFFAGKVLLAVRHYVSECIDSGIKLYPADRRRSSVRTDSSFQSNQSPIMSRNARSRHEFVQLPGSQVVEKMDTYAAQVRSAVNKLVEQLERDGNQIDASFVSTSKDIVEIIGQLLSFLHECQLDMKNSKSTSNESATNDNEQWTVVVNDYRVAIESLQQSVSGLMSVVNFASDAFAPSDWVRQIMTHTTVVLRSVKDVIVSTKLLVEKKESREAVELKRAITRQMEEQKTDISIPQLRTTNRRAISLEALPKVTASRPSDMESLSELTEQKAEDETSSLTSETLLRPPPNQLRSRSNKSTSLAMRTAGSSLVSLKKHSLPSDSKVKQFFGENAKSNDIHKIQKFFGEMPPMSPTGSGISVNKLHFGTDYGLGDLLFNMDGDNKVKAGTLEALVARLTAHDVQGTTHRQVL